MMKIKSSILDLFFPQRCAICDTVTETENAICLSCQQNRLIDQKSVCKKCGKPNDNCICGNFPFSFLAAVSAITYDLSAVGAIKALKFDTKSSVSLCFAKMMYTSFINSEIDFDASFITYVPMNKIKERQRGKNQAETLCRHLAWKLNLPIIPPPAIHADNTVSQHSLNSHERWKNAENIYIPTHDKVSGNIILVDDIMTTGATLEIMSQILLKAGAKSILCLTSATTLKD